MLKRVTFKGFTASVVNLVEDGWRNGAVFLELLGPENAVKAIWARLSLQSPRSDRGY